MHEESGNYDRARRGRPHSHISPDLTFSLIENFVMPPMNAAKCRCKTVDVGLTGPHADCSSPGLSQCNLRCDMIRLCGPLGRLEQKD